MTANAARVAVADQLDAAWREARAMLECLAAELAGPHAAFPPEPGPYATELLLGISQRMTHGEAVLCSHLRRSPGMSWLFGWQPDLLHCHACALVQLAEHSGTDQEHTCHVCRRTLPTVTVVLGSCGPMIVAFGACDGCYARETGAAA